MTDAASDQVNLALLPIADGLRGLLIRSDEGRRAAIIGVLGDGSLEILHDPATRPGWIHRDAIGRYPDRILPYERIHWTVAGLVPVVVLDRGPTAGHRRVRFPPDERPPRIIASGVRRAVAPAAR